MRVLLIYANPARDLLPAPPIGLAYVAAATRRAGHEVHVLDLVASPRPLDDVRATVRALGPAVVGFSVRNIDNVIRQRPVWHLGALAPLLAAVREAGPARIVLGGPAVSILGAATLAHLDADFAVVGEGEAALPRLLEALAAGRAAVGLPGICARHGQRVVSTPPALLPAFGASEMEAWVDWRAYERRGGTWAIQTKRGCPLSCVYCAYPAIEGRQIRRRPVAEVVDEIERVRERVGPRTFEIVDSTFNVPPEHAQALCREIVRRRLRIRLSAMGVNPLGVSAELFALMRQAGFNSMMITPEAASDPVLRRLGKGFTAEDVRRTARLARQAGIASAWFFMLGGPGETRATVEATVRFIEEHLNWPGCVSIVMTGIRLLPGTALAREALAAGDLGPEADLARPAFYLSPDVDEAWILERLGRALGRGPAIVHAAEEGRSRYERWVDRALWALGVAPPYWRFLPWLLRLPPVRASRRRQPPGVGALGPLPG